jgi:hypothetical protein
MNKTEKIEHLLLSAFPVDDPPQEPTKESVYFVENEWAKSMFLGKRWTELNLRGYHKNETEAVFPFVTPEALQYYFPGLLLAFLDEETQENSGLLLDILLYTILTIQLPLSLDDYYYQIKDFLIHLSNYQKYPIALWIEKMEEDENNSLLPEDWDALKAYWAPYLTPPK